MPVMIRTNFFADLTSQKIPRQFSQLSSLLIVIFALASDGLGSDELFRLTIAPIFQRKCLSCHNETDRKGGLSLESKESVHRGGESGEAVIVVGEPDKSSLVEQITPRNGKHAMPKGADPLSDAEIAAIRAWVQAGALWPNGFRIMTHNLSNADWWSLRPLREPRTAHLSQRSASWSANSVDHFVAKRHEELSLGPAMEAPRQSLIRRLYFDIIGLPPSADDVEAFVRDRDPAAYDRLVDRLLASPHHGERWGRHWLDVVHFGETHGYDKDKPRPNAWPYRDYVIRAFNSDKPYAQFVQEQIAGDVLFPHTCDGIEALGFIAAGPWDFIGHVEIPESKIDGKIARHLDRDDMVSNAINSFCSLTVQCAQCHNHKFDPISQEDYYSLQAVFAGVDRADKPYDLDPQVAEQRALFQKLFDLRQNEKTILDQQITRYGPELAELDRQIAAAKGAKKNVPPEHGYHSTIETDPNRPKWVQVDLGTQAEIASLEFVACHDDFNGIGAGFGFPLRFRIEASSNLEFESDTRLLVDRTEEDVTNPGVVAQSVRIGRQVARFVRFTATKLAPRQNDYIFALSEFRVLGPDGTNLAAGKEVTSLDSIEAAPRWGRKNLVDGRFPTAPIEAKEIAQLELRRAELYEQKVPSPIRALVNDSSATLDRIQQSLRDLPTPNLVFAGTVHNGSGNFSGTGKNGGRPREIRILARGDVLQPRQLVRPGAIGSIGDLPARFELDNESEGTRRAHLARWLTHPDNPLTWRSIANRIWLYHFGRGIVDTPNDFGRMGDAPSHPELLDWLAVELRSNGGSIKRLHRWIVFSATYRQASQGVAEFAASDAENRFYTRMTRRRIEAEVIRDSLLFAAGRLRNEMGGPSFQDFVVEKPEHSPHYEYHLHDPMDIKSHRRSVYRFLVRSQTQPFMTTWDCADPSMLVDKRNSSITPLQALALLNNQLSVAMSRDMSERIESQFPDLEQQVVAAYRQTLSRSPSMEELPLMIAFAQKHGLANACRILINTNEFVFID